MAARCLKFVDICLCDRDRCRSCRWLQSSRHIFRGEILFLELYRDRWFIKVEIEVEIFSKFLTLLVLFIDYLSLCYFIGFPRNQTSWFVTVGEVQKYFS